MDSPLEVVVEGIFECIAAVPCWRIYGNDRYVAYAASEYNCRDKR